MKTDEQDITVVVLVGPRDFGRCPIATRLPAALWPVCGRPALKHLLLDVADQGIERAIVCCSDQTGTVRQAVDEIDGLDVEFMEDRLPVGTAGCIRDAMQRCKGQTIVLLPASLTCPPDIRVLVQEHRRSECALTVALNPGPHNGDDAAEPADIYVCGPEILECIPEGGYCDIKEGLVPELLRNAKPIHPAVLTRPAGNFRDYQTYLDGMIHYIANWADCHVDNIERDYAQIPEAGRAPGASVHPDARVQGPAILLDGARVEEGATIIGPSLIGRDVVVGRNTIIEHSVIWDNTTVGAQCDIYKSVVDCGQVIPNRTTVRGESVGVLPRSALGTMAGCIFRAAARSLKELRSLTNRSPAVGVRTLSERAGSPKAPPYVWLLGGLVVVAFLWSCRPQFSELWGIWYRSDEYSSGLLVAPLAVWVLWLRRRDLASCPIKPCAWGIAALILAQAVRVFGLMFYFGSAERLSIVLTVAALVLLMFGLRILWKTAPAVLFLILMLPWPRSFQAAVTVPLQEYATRSAVFCLQMVGYDVVRHGNIIQIGDASVAVAEACNGLRMITAFFVIGGLVALLVKRSWWEKIIVFASSLPIALLCNTLRLAITAIFFTMLQGEQWEKLFHDFGGYAMMPLALAIVVAELWALKKLTTMPVQAEPVVITRTR